MKTHAEQTSAALTASPQYTAAGAPALVCPVTSVRLQHADQNAFCIRTVLPVRLAFRASVLIRANELVDKMQDVNPSIIDQSALALKDFKATQLLHVIQNRVSRNLNSTLTNIDNKRISIFSFKLNKLLPVEPEAPSKNPCEPSPCGPYSECKDQAGFPQCSCKAGYFGRPPSCRPECTQNGDCAPNLACTREKCLNPCTDVCGLNADCEVVNHIPRCSCPRNYNGDPYSQCSKIPEVITPVVPEEPTDPCRPSPCGSNANCQATGNRAVCICQAGFFGDPFVACRPECVLNSECPSDKACINQKCVDPCPGTCGINAVCHVHNHFTICMCEEGFIGDPFTRCQLKPRMSSFYKHTLFYFFPITTFTK